MASKCDGFKSVYDGAWNSVGLPKDLFSFSRDGESRG
jgi:hypothetical protein